MNSRWKQWTAVAAGAFLLVFFYLPLLRWLVGTVLTLDQLHAGGLLLLFALFSGFREVYRARPAPLHPHLNDYGLLLFLLGMACLWIASLWRALALPLVLFSFCLSLAAMAAFLFGKKSVPHFMPALVCFMVFGLLAGLFPSLDWPLRRLSGRLSASLLQVLRVPARLVLLATRPPELLLYVRERVFSVATECSGFGLLTSSLLLASILAFQQPRSWLDRAVLLGLSALTAVAFNMLRIVAISLAATRIPLPYGVLHEGLGTLAFLLGLLAVALVAREGKKGEQR